MSDGEAPPALGVRCDRAGTVVEVVTDTLRSGLGPGRGFAEVASTASAQDVLGLLADADRGLLTGPVTFQLRDDRGRLHVVGCGEDGTHILLVGAPTVAGLSSAVDEVASRVPGVQEVLRRLSAPSQADVADADVLVAMSEANNELVGMHRELARTNAELGQLNRRKDEIMAMVAHDLRNPLGSIAGFSAALERRLGETLDGPSRQMLCRIQAISGRMLDLVDNLLDTSVIQNDTLRLELEPTDLHGLLSDTVANHQHAARDKGVDLRLDVDHPAVTAWVDPSRLVQVVDNLLSNAIKFSPADVGAPVVVLCRTPDADHVTIVVRDDGMGLPAEERERLFEPFARPSRMGTSEERGTGLGLAITRSIVDAHGGSIGVASEAGEGATFTVSLPIRPDGPA